MELNKMSESNLSGGGSIVKYAVWNNKGGVGKTLLSFILATEYAENNPDQNIIVVDMCPQANLSEILLGGNQNLGVELNEMLQQANRKTVGGYIDSRIDSPHSPTGREHEFLIKVNDYNNNIPENVYLVCGDPSLELQAQVIAQIGSQLLPKDTWKNTRYWIKDLIDGCAKHYMSDKAVTAIVDCNPSFSSYTELAIVASDKIILPCSSDGSSARAINNMAALVYGMGVNEGYVSSAFPSKCKELDVTLPVIHSLVLNRSTIYNVKASKAFAAMNKNIKSRFESLCNTGLGEYVENYDDVFIEVPDTHSVAIVCSHLGLPLNKLEVGKYEVFDEEPQVNEGPLDRYKEHVKGLVNSL